MKTNKKHDEIRANSASYLETVINVFQYELYVKYMFYDSDLWHYKVR